MSVTRIIRRNLQRMGEVQKGFHKKERVWFMENGKPAFRPRTAWKDLRVRDSEGNLAGYCSRMQAKLKRKAESKLPYKEA